jgi:hypothetical protein
MSRLLAVHAPPLTGDSAGCRSAWRPKDAAITPAELTKARAAVAAQYRPATTANPAVATHAANGGRYVTGIFARYDVDKNGKLCKDEFAKARLARFAHADVNKDNVVTRDEIRTVITAIRTRIAAAQSSAVANAKPGTTQAPAASRAVVAPPSTKPAAPSNKHPAPGAHHARVTPATPPGAVIPGSPGGAVNTQKKG